MRRPEHHSAALAARFVFAAIFLVASRPGGAEDVGRKLENVERAIGETQARQSELAREAKALAREVGELRQKLVAAARATQQYEAKLADLEARLGALTAEEAEARANLGRMRGQLAATLAALERVALYPPEAMIALASNAGDVVRGALLLRTVVPRLEERAATLRAALNEYTELRANITHQRGKIQTASLSLESRRAHVATLLGERARLQRRT